MTARTNNPDTTPRHRSDGDVRWLGVFPLRVAAAVLLASAVLGFAITWRWAA